MGSVARMDLKLPSKCRDVSSCPGLPLQLLARNPFFQRDRPELLPSPETKNITNLYYYILLFRLATSYSLNRRTENYHI